MEQNTDDKKKKKVGRPSKYPYEMLKNYLLEYATKNPGGLITNSALVKFSGLPLQAWRFNKEIRKDIEKLNTMQIIPSEGIPDIGLPSAEDIVNANYKNKDRLISAFSDLIDLYQKAYSEIVKLKKDVEKMEETKVELGKLKSDNKILEKEVEYYKNEMMKLTIKSSTDVGRAETGIRKNVVDIKAYTSETDTVFSDLFDD